MSVGGEEGTVQTVYLVKKLQTNSDGVHYESVVAAFTSKNRAMEDLKAQPEPGRVQDVTLYVGCNAGGGRRP